MLEPKPKDISNKNIEVSDNKDIAPVGATEEVFSITNNETQNLLPSSTNVTSFQQQNALAPQGSSFNTTANNRTLDNQLKQKSNSQVSSMVGGANVQQQVQIPRSISKDDVLQSQINNSQLSSKSLSKDGTMKNVQLRVGS